MYFFELDEKNKKSTYKFSELFKFPERSRREDKSSE